MSAEAPAAPQVRRLRRRHAPGWLVNAWLALLVMLLALYVGCVAVTVAPPSPAQVRLSKYTNKVIHPYFDQVWTLFAPDPPTSNTESFYRIEYRRDGRLVTTDAIPVSAAFMKATRSVPLMPSRLDRVATNINLTIVRNSKAKQDLEKAVAVLERAEGADRDTVRIAHLRSSSAVLDEDMARHIHSLRRLLSALAAERVPRGAEIVNVRYHIYVRPITPFSGRSASLDEDRFEAYDSQWQPFVPGVSL